MLKHSKQRDTILRILKGTSTHPTADWIYEHARKEIPNISFATVYRNLKVLKDSGELLELDLGEGPSHYNGYINDHYHLRCEKCGRILDLEEPVDKAIDKRITRKTGHKITHHVLEFRGICKDCRTSSR